MRVAAVQPDARLADVDANLQAALDRRNVQGRPARKARTNPLGRLELVWRKAG